MTKNVEGDVERANCSVALSARVTKGSASSPTSYPFETISQSHHWKYGQKSYMRYSEDDRACSSMEIVLVQKKIRKNGNITFGRDLKIDLE